MKNLRDDGDTDFLAEFMLRAAERAAQENTPERIAERARQQAERDRQEAAIRRTMMAARADKAGVPALDAVRRYALDDNAERWEALEACHDALTKWESLRARRVITPFVVVLGAAVGRGKSVATCHACLRSERTFLRVTGADWPTRKYAEEEHERRESMAKVELLIIDDLELLPENDWLLQPLMRRRFDAGLFTLAAGNVNSLKAIGMFGEAMMSRLMDQEATTGQPWFLPRDATAKGRGDLLGPTLRAMPTATR